MNRNTEAHFSQVPKINIPRSKFDMSHSHKTTFNTGELIPIYVDSDILPGDTVQMDIASLVRMATPIFPTMDNIYMDIYFFFVPHRIVYDGWTTFWGESNQPWAPVGNTGLPEIQAPTAGWNEGTIADYFGLPTKVGGYTISHFPFRAYCKIFNDWFRDQSVQAEAYYNPAIGSNALVGVNDGDIYQNAYRGGKPLRASKLHDYFTSCLPSPQRANAPVTLAVGDTAAVYAGTTEHSTNIGNPIKFRTVSNVTTSNFPTNSYFNITGKTNSNNNITMESYAIAPPETTPANGAFTAVSPTNLYADLNNATAVTINAIRQAFALQRYFENAGMAGTRYIEFIRSVFGVVSSDARFARSEYVGGKRIPINLDQVLQTSATNDVSPQGNVAGFSCTIDRDSLFTKSFEEHGTLMGIAVCRTEHTYQQGLEKMWTRKKWTQFYNPFFQGLGEQPVYQKEIYATEQNTGQNNESDANNVVFGYQEAFAEYKYKNSYVTGYFRSNATGTLDSWHYADNYTTAPTLSAGWIVEPHENVDRTLAVSSQIAHQFIADFYFKTFYTRPMPVYNIPAGLTRM